MAKTIDVLAIELLQTAVIVATGLALGWDITGGVALALLLLLIGTIAFAAIGMLMAGTLRAEATLALANGLFLVLLFLGGMAYPLRRLPDVLEGRRACVSSPPRRCGIAYRSRWAPRSWALASAHCLGFQ